jgi:hypothetical protein
MSSLNDGTVRVQSTSSTSLWITLKIHKKKKKNVLIVNLATCLWSQSKSSETILLYSTCILCELMGWTYEMLHQLTRFVFIFIISIVVGFSHEAEQLGSRETDIRQDR